MKKGFTLVELMAVIAILAVLAIIAVPTYNVVSNKIKQSSYETKLENIISHAESYAENTNNFVFDVGTLIEQGLLGADNEAGEYLDPRNGRDMRCDIINVVFENNQYVASVTESDTCYTDEDLQNLFGMFEIVIYRPDGTKVEPIEGTDWIREQDIVLKYELKEEYKNKGYEENITQIIWSGEQEKVCEQSNLSSCEGYDIHTEVIKNVTVNLQVNIKINGSIVISRTNKKVLVDLELPKVDNVVTGTDLNEQEKNRTEFDLSDGNGSGIKYYAILPSTGTCSGSEYEKARKNINGNHVVEYLDSGTYKICVEDNVGNKGEGSVTLSEINFDPTGGTLEIDKKVIGTNTSYGVMPTPTKQYYEFLGWYTEKEGGTQVTPDTVLTGDITVYAHWKLIAFKVVYDYQTNGGSSVSQKEDMVQIGSPVNLNVTASKNEYDFVGWNTNSNATSGLSSLTMGTKDITLYAIYKKTVYVTLYDYNGQSRRTRRVHGYAYNKNTVASITLPSLGTWNTYRCNNGDSLGWSTSTSPTASVTHNAGGTYNFSSDTSLYALYQKYTAIYLDTWHDKVEVLNVKSPDGYRKLNGSGNFTAVPSSGSQALWNSGQYSYAGGINGTWNYTFRTDCPWNHNGDQFSGWICTSSDYGSDDCRRYGNWGGFSVTYYCSMNYSCNYR